MCMRDRRSGERPRSSACRATMLGPGHGTPRTSRGEHDDRRQGDALRRRTHIEDAEAALRKLDRALGVPARAGGLLDDLEEATRQLRALLVGHIPPREEEREARLRLRYLARHGFLRPGAAS